MERRPMCQTQTFNFPEGFQHQTNFSKGLVRKWSVILSSSCYCLRSTAT